MRRLSRSPSMKPPLPLSKSPSGLPLPRKSRMPSQRTLDTASPLPGSQLDSLARINEEEVLREVKESLRAMDDYRNNLLRSRQEERGEREELQRREAVLREKTRELEELREQVGRLKQVYGRTRPRVGSGKASSPASEYSQQHLKVFTLAEQLQKLRKHLELHIDHHRSLKQKAKDLHNSIKTLLPQYYELEVRRGLKPVSYGDFRKRAIAAKNEQRAKERLRSRSQRSLSIRSRSGSVREIVDGSLLAPPAEKTLWHMQRKRSILTRARGTSQRKFDSQARTLQEQVDFLRKEDGLLDQKIQELIAESKILEASLNHSTEFTFIRSHTALKPPE